MKYILVVGDGMADEPLAVLNDCTPLQAANTPHADRIASAGELGTVLTVPKNVTPGTDTAFVGIMGYDVTSQYTGRSPLEAAAMGIDLPDGHTAFRCNLVSLTPGVKLGDAYMLSHSGGQISGDDGYEIMTWLKNHPRFEERMQEMDMELHVGSSYRHIVTMGKEYWESAREHNLKVTPPHEILGEPVREHLPVGTMAYALLDVTKLSYELLPTHPFNRKKQKSGGLQANAVWLWGQGSRPHFMPWIEKFGIRGSVISAVPLVNGIGLLCGLKSIAVEGATGELDTNYDGKADAAVEALKKGDDFVLVHVEAPDECAHNNDLAGKIEAISRLDAMLGRILKGLDAMGEDYRLLFVSDHYTTIRTRAHASGAVPYVLYDSRKDAGAKRTYDEKCAGSTGVYLRFGMQLMPRLLEKE
ncbi:MAG: 2,3-bisphosphoglycerate-independent phosphoglycerate mutase [Bacillota bacterium]